MRGGTDFGGLSKYGMPHELVEQILNDGVTAIQLRDDLEDGVLATHRPAFAVIQLNRNIDRETVAKRISTQMQFDLCANEVFTFGLLHEWKHFRARREGRKASEQECDTFAKEYLSRMRGYTRKFKISIDVDIPKLIRESLR